MPHVSIILPCYNVENYIASCLDSLMNQTLADIEIICIDDKSTDKTLQIIKKYAKKDRRIVVVAQKQNAGAAVCRNAGLSVATGDYIGFVDPDDSVDLDFFEKLYNKALATGADVVKGNVHITYANTGNFYVSDLQKNIKKSIVRFNAHFWSAIYKRTFLVHNNIKFPSEIRVSQDAVFLTMVTLATTDIQFVDNVYYNYIYQRPDSLDSSALSHKKASSKYNAFTLNLDLICANKNMKHRLRNQFIRRHVLDYATYEIRKNFESDSDKQKMFELLHILYSQYRLPRRFFKSFTRRERCAIKKNNFALFIDNQKRAKKILYKEVLPNKQRNIYVFGIRLFSKKRFNNGRREIYLFGLKVASYKKRKSNVGNSNIKQIAKYCSDDKLPILLRDYFFQRTGKLPTEELVTLNEKIIWASMFDVTPEKTKLADKYTVRDHVAKTIGEKYLIKLLGVWDTPETVNLENMPDKFVLKHSDGSGKVYLVPNKKDINMSNIKPMLRTWSISEFWTEALEMQYKKSARKFIAEEYVDTKIEYKLWCFGGKCKFIKIEIMNEFATTGKPKNQTGKYFYPDWTAADFKTVGNEPRHEIPKPKKLKELLEISEKLASQFDFVRVDFFETNDGELKFGEMTFSPAAGRVHFVPSIKDTLFGQMFKLPPRDQNGFAIR